MNKYEKAFDVIETILHLMCGEEREDGYKPSHDEMVNSMEDFKELVERATPKKPIKNKMRREKTSSIDKLFEIKNPYTCPNCGNALLEHYMNEHQETRYCWDCGQALDWRVENVK